MEGIELNPYLIQMLEEIQNLEELGARELKDYILVLQELQEEISKNLENEGQCAH